MELSDQGVASLVDLYESILWCQINMVCCYLGTTEVHPRKSAIALEFAMHEGIIRKKEEALARLDGQEFETSLTRALINKLKKEDEPALEDQVNSSAVDETSPSSVVDETSSIQSESEAEGSESSAQTETSLTNTLRVVEEPDLQPRMSEDFTFKPLYDWLCDTPEYGKFLSVNATPDECILWLQGGPGSGKTELLQVAIARLPGEETSPGEFGAKCVAYTFCSSSIPSKMTALSAVRSLIYHLLKSQPRCLCEHFSEQIDKIGRGDFNDTSDYYALSTILYSLIGHERFQPTYFVIDELDALAADDSLVRLQSRTGTRLSELERFLDLVSTTVKVSQKVRWLVSYNCDRRITRPSSVKEKMALSLTLCEVVEAISEVSDSYAASRVAEVAEAANYKGTLKEEVTKRIQQASSNFLWIDIALDIAKTSLTPWNAPDIIEDLRASSIHIELLYATRYGALESLSVRDYEYCRSILSSVAIAFRPLLSTELASILQIPPEVDLAILVRNFLVPFVEMYQWEPSEQLAVRFSRPSARRFILQHMSKNEGLENEHHRLARGCLEILLERYNCSHYSREPGHSVGVIGASVNYATLSWILHLSEIYPHAEKVLALAMHFLEKHCVSWMETLDSQNAILEALVLLSGLELALKSQVRPIFGRQKSRPFANCVSPLEYSHGNLVIKSMKTFIALLWMSASS